MVLFSILIIAVLASVLMKRKTVVIFMWAAYLILGLLIFCYLLINSLKEEQEATIARPLAYYQYHLNTLALFLIIATAVLRLAGSALIFFFALFLNEMDNVIRTQLIINNLENNREDDSVGGSGDSGNNIAIKVTGSVNTNSNSNSRANYDSNTNTNTNSKLNPYYSVSFSDNFMKRPVINITGRNEFASATHNNQSFEPTDHPESLEKEGYIYVGSDNTGTMKDKMNMDLYYQRIIKVNKDTK